jgi:hypothetical protein
VRGCYRGSDYLVEIRSFDCNNNEFEKVGAYKIRIHFCILIWGRRSFLFIFFIVNRFSYIR